MPGNNPYLQDYANSLSSNLTNNLNWNILPGINQQALANGGVGGSRQGIAQGLAIGDTNRAIANAQAGLYSNAYGQDQQYDLNSTIANQNFYSTQRGQDLQQAGLGSSLANMGNQGLAQQGQQLYNAGQQQYQAPFNALQWYGQSLSPFTGLNQSTTQNVPGGSTLGNIASGALTAAQLWKLFGG